jgi:hypothetical protein
MNLILECGYVGNADMIQENVRPLLVSAGYLIVPDLLELCRDFLRSTVLTDIVRLARDYSKWTQVAS